MPDDCEFFDGGEHGGMVAEKGEERDRVAATRAGAGLRQCYGFGGFAGGVVSGMTLTLMTGCPEFV